MLISKGLRSKKGEEAPTERDCCRGITGEISKKCKKMLRPNEFDSENYNENDCM